MNKTPLSKLFVVLVILFIASGLYSCVDDDKTVSKETLEVNNYIKEYMDFTYLWNTQMPKIDQTQEADPEAYFYKLLNKDYDKWSFIRSDYKEFMDLMTGTETSMGFSVQPYLVAENSTDVVAFVEYVEPDGPAEKANIKRGDIIYKINGQKLTTSNYYELMGKSSYTITFAALTQSYQIVELSPTVGITATVMHNNAVLLDTVYEVGAKKVGYMVYNTFSTDHTNSLGAALVKLKSSDIDEMVLDLRYNGGGYDSLSTLLASSIGPAANVGKTMYNSTYNASLTDYYKNQVPNSAGFFTTKFISTPYQLDLKRLFVLTTNNTASASETVMYSLSPYIDVIQIGLTTTGKYYGMFVIPGPDNNTGPWVILPIVTRAENSDKSIKYEDGLVPDYEMKDDYDHELGDRNEKLLAKALSIISETAYSASPGLKNAFINKNAVAIKGAKEKLSPLKFTQIMNGPIPSVSK